MKMNRSKAVITAMVTLLAFLSVTYISCTKNDNSTNDGKCATVTCKNGGVCNGGICQCPTGYEDSTCATEWSAKYLGSWKVMQKINDIVIDSTYLADTSDIGDTSTYYVTITATATPNSFFINDFNGNTQYDNLICTLDTNNYSPYSFVIKPYTPTFGDTTFHIIGGYGTISSSLNSISGMYYSRRMDNFNHPEYDTVSINLSLISR